MELDELQNLISYCQSRGGLNLSDISRWLEEHLPTVREWASKGREPRKARRMQVLARMRKLRDLVDGQEGTLIPQNTKLYERAHAITELRNATFRISRESVTG